MIWFFFCAWAHPFDAKLYGHDIQISLEQGNLSVSYQLEIPFDVVQEELKQLLQNSAQIPMEELRILYLSKRYEGIAGQLLLQIDGEDVSWDFWSPTSDKLKQENRFLIFHLNMTKSLSQGAHQISLWNRNHEEAISIYRTAIQYEGGVWIDRCDLEEPNKWSKEDTMRETRISVRILPSLWAMMEQYWFQYRNDSSQKVFAYQDESEASLGYRMLRKELSLLEASILFGLSIVLSMAYPFQNRKRGFGWVLLILGIAMMLPSWGDNRLWMTMVLSVVGLRYPALLCILWLYLCVPLVGLVGILPAFLPHKSLSYPYIWFLVILLSFFVFVT